MESIIYHTSFSSVLLRPRSLNRELKSRLFRGGTRNANIVYIKNRQSCGEETKQNKFFKNNHALLRLYLSRLPHLILSLSLSYFTNL